MTDSHFGLLRCSKMSTRYPRNCHLFSDHLGGLLFNQNHQPILLSQSQTNSRLLSQDVLVMRTTLNVVRKALLAPSRTVSLLVACLGGEVSRRSRFCKLKTKYEGKHYDAENELLRVYLRTFSIYLVQVVANNAIPTRISIDSLRTPKLRCSRAGYYHQQP